MSSSRSLLDRLHHRHQMPRQQLVDAVDRMVSDALKHRVQVGKRLDTVQARRLCRLPNYAERARFRSGSM
jgi:hypothetical protein